MTAPTEIARAWLSQSPVFIDTETTGFHRTAEICDLAVLDQDGAALINTLVRPTRAIPPDAYAIHGISDRDVANAPTFAQVCPQLAQLLRTRLAVIWNAAFDVRLLRQSLAAHNLPADRLPITSVCAMELYARHWGDTRRDGTYTWQSLLSAARQCRIPWNLDAHRALPDADMCRRIVLHLAALAVPRPAADGPAQPPLL